MKKTFGQGAVLLLIFLLVWVGLSCIDWMNIFSINQRIKAFSEKITPLYIDVLKGENAECQSPEISLPVDSLLNAVCKSNKLNKSDFHVLILQNDVINAFALPAGYIVVNTGLLNSLDNPEQFAAVLCHEMAHIQHKHVMKKMIKEVGITALLSNATGSNPSLLIEAVKKISATSYDRSLESEADLTASEYLVNTGMSPYAICRALKRIEEASNHSGIMPEWLSTHPNTNNRIAFIEQQYKQKAIHSVNIVHPESWKKLQESVKNNDFYHNNFNDEY